LRLTKQKKEKEKERERERSFQQKHEDDYSRQQIHRGYSTPSTGKEMLTRLCHEDYKLDTQKREWITSYTGKTTHCSTVSQEIED
jgi:hypothetical protein